MKALTVLTSLFACTLLSQAEPIRRPVISNGASQIDWTMRSAELGIEGPAFTVRKLSLRGGKQQGVELIEVDNGTLKFTVVPTRGMSLLRVDCGDLRLGWDSPVKEVVHPQFINLEARGGLGWLDGFNETMVRCGFENAGHPGMDGDRLITLHGRAGNIPASEVEVVIDDKPPHRIRIRGLVQEKTFKFADFEMWTEISTVPGSNAFRFSDVLTNKSNYEREFQLIYHANFGRPLLQADARFVAAVKSVTPFDDYAAKDMGRWTTYLGPTAGYGEQVYNVIPHAKADGTSQVMLRNAEGNRGVALSYDTAQLPYFTLWKNTDTAEEGYVTGLEPGTGFPYNRSVERERGRVPKLKGGASRSFELEFTVLRDANEVEAAAKAIKAIGADKPSTVNAEPEK